MEERKDYGYGICGMCYSPLIWQCDYDFEDFGYEGEGIVGCAVCSGCGAEVEFRLKTNEEEQERL